MKIPQQLLIRLTRASLLINFQEQTQFNPHLIHNLEPQPAQPMVSPSQSTITILISLGRPLQFQQDLSQIGAKIRHHLTGTGWQSLLAVMAQTSQRSPEVLHSSTHQLIRVPAGQSKQIQVPETGTPSHLAAMEQSLQLLTTVD